MSPLVESIVISGSIFAFSMLKGFGTQAVTRRSLLMPAGICAAFAFMYVKGAPTSAADLQMYGIGIVLGILFGSVGALATRVRHNRSGEHTGTVTTEAGIGYAATWFVGLSARIAMVWALTDVPWVHDHVGRFLVEHQINPDTALPAFFVLWAITMVGVRTLSIAVRAAQQQPALVAA